MAVKAGKIILDSANVGAGGWNEFVEANFNPHAVLFIWADMTVEDVWVVDDTGYNQGGMGFASLVNTITGGAGTAGTGVENANNFQLWGNAGIASSQFSPLLAMLAKSDHSTFNYGLSVRAFDADGFTLRFANGGTLATDADGKIIYYLAFGGRESAVSFPESTPGSDALNINSLTTTFTPKGLLGVGGPVTGYTDVAYDSYSAISFQDASFPEGQVLAKAQGQRFILTGGGDATFWDELTPYPYHRSYDFDDSGFVAPADLYESFFVVNPTSLDTGVQATFGFSYSSNFTKLGHLVLGAADFEIGFFYPNAVVDDTPEQVDTALIPEAFVFMSGPGIAPLTDGVIVHDGPNNSDVYTGQTTIGFLTADFQCVVTWGGVLTGNSAKFQSSQYSWVSNYVDTSPIGAFPTLGDATLSDEGFAHVTRQNDAASEHRVMWWAIGDLEDVIYLEASMDGLRTDALSRTIKRIY